MANETQVKSRLGGGIPLRGQSREIVSNVYKFMKEEADKSTCTIPIAHARERTAKASGVSVRLVSKILSEREKLKTSEAGQSFSTPNKQRRRERPITGMDDFDKNVVRRTVHHFYANEKRIPTAELLRSALKEKIGFKGGVTSIRLILKEIGFQWKTTESNRKILVERMDIREKRIRYLQQIKRYREEGRPIIYMDESYVLTSHVSGKTWTDSSNKCLHKPTSKGERIIIIHAGGEKGFVPNALAMWKAGQSSGDYHEQMNRRNYEKWIKEKLLPNLESRSVLVIDNAPYHNIEIDKAPSSNSKKHEMIAWLQDRGIPCSGDTLKPQLYKLIQLHKPMYKRFVVNELLEREGHSVLRLPPYHPELNPIELIWADIKSCVARHNTTFTMKDVRDICEKKFAEMGPEDWLPKCRHVKGIEEEYMSREPIIDSVIDSFIIRIGDDDDDDENGSSDGDSDVDTGAVSGIEELP